MFVKKYLLKYGYITVQDQGNQTGMGRSRGFDEKEIIEGLK